MTKKQLRKAVILVIASYAGLGVFAFALRVFLPEGNRLFDGYQVTVPFIFAIPAALLGYAFQQRGSYLGSLRALWSQLVRSVNGAIQYTFDDSPNMRQQADALMQLSVAIDEVRGVYMNVGESGGNVGLYPYEPMKSIYSVIHNLGYGQLDPATRKQARENIVRHWQSIRTAFLSEFDRAEPTTPITGPRST